MAQDYEFQGWLGYSPEAADGKMEWGSFEPKTWTEDDIDIQVTHCGICGSDIHTLSSGWGPSNYRKAVRVGKNINNIKIGDRVGAGAQSRSCLEADCPECSVGEFVYCSRTKTDTYNGTYANGEGKSYGGYADYHRTNGNFAVRIPDGLSSEAAAPMLCGGVTVWSPLKDNGCGPGKSVGIVGVGGLGHFAVLFAKALGADNVVGISRKASKKDDVLKLGADSYIATAEDVDWAKKNQRSLDLIICTVSSAKMPLDEYLSLLKIGGSFIQVGAPDGGELPNISAFRLILNKIKVGGSNIGTPAEIQEMLDFAAEKNIKPWVEVRPMAEANKAIRDFNAGLPKFRYVLANEKHIG
ncbi:hypothetical protein ACHAQA_000217 [Verticillium albo-atrum]